MDRHLFISQIFSFLVHYTDDHPSGSFFPPFQTNVLQTSKPHEFVDASLRHPISEFNNASQSPLPQVKKAGGGGSISQAKQAVYEKRRGQKSRGVRRPEAVHRRAIVAESIHTHTHTSAPLSRDLEISDVDTR